MSVRLWHKKSMATCTFYRGFSADVELCLSIKSVHLSWQKQKDPPEVLPYYYLRSNLQSVVSAFWTQRRPADFVSFSEIPGKRHNPFWLQCYFAWSVHNSLSAPKAWKDYFYLQYTKHLTQQIFLTLLYVFISIQHSLPTLTMRIFPSVWEESMTYQWKWNKFSMCLSQFLSSAVSTLVFQHQC